MKLTAMTAAVLTAAALGDAAEKRPMTIDDLLKIRRVSGPQISPDGEHVVYGVAEVVMGENRTKGGLHIAAADGATPPRPLTVTDKRDGHPRWSPDGRYVLFESSRSGSGQLHVIDVNGGEARPLTDVATGAGNAVWSPDGKHIAFVSAVRPEYSHLPFAESNKKNREWAEKQEQNPVKARVFTKLFFRHWDSYVEGKRRHLFVMSFDPKTGEAGEPRDLTPGDHDAYPTSSTFSVGDDFTFSPDSKFVVFTAPPKTAEAWSTDHNICRVPVAGGEVETLTGDNPAADSAPRYSPDGKTLAYRAQRRAGFEADRYELMVAPCDAGGKPAAKAKSITESFDRSVDDFLWSADGKSILFHAQEGPAYSVFRVPAAGGNPAVTVGGKSGSVFGLTRSRDGSRFAYSRPSLGHAPVVCVLDAGQTEPRVFDPNEKLFARLDIPEPESVEVEVEGAKMQMWVLKPPGFNPDQKWPMVYLVHGGPQGAWLDAWSYRWNPALWAARGYVVAAPNPRGSTGFGQKFTDEITGDWGGKVYDDLMKGLAHMESQKYIDADRLAAAGASYGGYMMNWFAVNTGKFKTLITHCGVYNFESLATTTEELWFDEWEHGGPPWAGGKRDSFAKHSPHRLAANLGKFKTPMLIIHNDLDFRVPIGEGLQLFTALQRQGVESKMINFPDEGHWVLKPKNSEYWHEQVFAWLEKHVKPGGK